jgi:hypothetical protein
MEGGGRVVQIPEAKEGIMSFSYGYHFCNEFGINSQINCLRGTFRRPTARDALQELKETSVMLQQMIQQVEKMVSESERNPGADR